MLNGNGVYHLFFGTQYALSQKLASQLTAGRAARSCAAVLQAF